jgi:DeoR/GlpR family transcriptional regulator of sugar metabolism
MNLEQRQRRTMVTTDVAALAMGVSEATIRKWASRGKITRYGTAQRAKYDLAELFQVYQDRGRPGGRCPTAGAADC